MSTVIPFESAKPAAAPKPERVGVLLVNLGTPDTADAAGVRVYLREFLSDPRVIEDQGLLWKLILNCIILRVRPARKARDYLKIWNTAKNESPLKTITRSQADKLAEAIADHDHVVVDWAMRYGNPSIKQRIEALAAQGCSRLLLVPLYPQYSAATSATVCDEAFRVLAAMRAQPILRVTPPYYDDPDYIEALAVSINDHLATLPFEPEIILASFHGMPKAYVDKGDPYQAQCIATTNALRKAARARCRQADPHLPVALRQCRVAAALYRQDGREAGQGRRAANCRGHARLLRRLPGDAGGDRAGECRDLPAQWRRAVRGHPLPQRQRRRHGRDPPARAARASGLDLARLDPGGFDLIVNDP
ncbi:ferrochelatase [Bradyrhizobium sp. JR6.1]